MFYYQEVFSDFSLFIHPHLLQNALFCETNGSEGGENRTFRNQDLFDSPASFLFSKSALTLDTVDFGARRALETRSAVFTFLYHNLGEREHENIDVMLHGLE